MAKTAYLLIMILYVNILNTLIKRCGVAAWIKKKKKKQGSSIRCQRETHFRYKDRQTENEGLEKDMLCNENQKKARIAILIPDKMDFKAKIVISDKERR